MKVVELDREKKKSNNAIKLQARSIRVHFDLGQQFPTNTTLRERILSRIESKETRGSK